MTLLGQATLLSEVTWVYYICQHLLGLTKQLSKLGVTKQLFELTRDWCKKNENGFFYTPKIDFFYVENFLKNVLLVHLRSQKTSKSVFIGSMYTVFEIVKHCNNEVHVHFADTGIMCTKMTKCPKMGKYGWILKIFVSKTINS